MRITVNISDELARKAQKMGLQVEVYVQHLVDEAAAGKSGEAQFVRFGTASKTPAAAAEEIQRIAARNALGGLRIKDLMHEGHKY